ncbi:endo alpha-1,4 polygalactosaminidase [Granulosicoccus antarcticus]|uniref:Glycoside-hydrolase family GH114 TIM-barrel domain-containing protein n=1 Tax=Granulosicoccus antarcticus IMCC3135 TaxID=1192854 RepID=A0A2Z2NJ89_9GAMM|nr:endo alpha-1,4 polygalactosaminidase [Granulosicoccus antarcticus]ASJ70565.1 hypothetical protein IMCC3135_02255 [Granulosicoccus antarcticus IMCC3135]
MRLNRGLVHRLLIIGILLFVSGCQSLSHTQESSFSLNDSWQLSALQNRSNSVTAAESADAILAMHLRKRGVDFAQLSSDTGYVVEGAVSRWHYAGGTSARPVAQLQLDVRDALTGDVVWSDSASDTGRRGQSLTALADELIQTLVEGIPLNAGKAASALPVGMVAEASSAKASDVPLIGGMALKVQASSLNTKGMANGEPLEGRSVAFYYGAQPPVDILSQYDRLVLEPDNIKPADLRAMSARGARAYAYLSVGEVGPTRAYARDMEPAWILGKNPAWDSNVLDLANPSLRKFLVKRAGQLQSDGYGGLFLDTMDSFNLIADTDAERERQQAGLVSLIAEFAKNFPEMKIITNRGFEVMDDIAAHIEAVAAESLYASWNNATQQYTSVPPGDREWLLSKLNHARDDLDLDVIAIDYLPPAQRDKARTVAARIAEHGFIPWVANPELDYIGIGALEVLPRKVLMIFDSTKDGPLEESPVHKFVATPVEYMGYVPEYLDVGREPWPAGELKGRYAGIVTWASRQFKDLAARPWLQKQLDDKVPMAFMVMPPVPMDSRMSESLGISVVQGLDVDSAQLAYRDEFIAPERSMGQRIDSFGLMSESIAASNTTHMSYADKNGKRADIVVTGEFGGFAWQPGLVEDGLDYETYWVVDPFKFLRAALKLPNAPMPDVTTESGKRLWMAHIDGDALPSWAELPGGRLGAEMIYRDILTKYPLPHTVSVVEGEMTEFDAYDDRRQRMFDIARKTFRLDHVELASHTYSHPFKWAKLSEYRKSGKYNLPIEGYEYTSERDIGGSIDFINRELAPPGKKLEVMLWSGDALPLASDLEVLEKRDVPNLNGGLTYITNARNTMTLVSPMARPVGKYLQVYAPIMNENMYTNDWLGPFDGFKRAIETFTLTETPRRLKPLNIYYHFYSGTKIAAIKALEAVYDWSTAQDIYPIHVSDYSRKVPDFRNAGVARYLDGRWKLSGLGEVRSIRMLGKGMWPELQGSAGLAGARQLHDGVYVHTNGASQVSFSLSDKPPKAVHLVSSNGRVLRWDERGEALTLRISAEMPVVVELGGGISRSCALRVGKQSISGQASSNNTVVFSFTTRDTGDAILNCPA